MISKLIDNRYTALINDTLNQLYKFEGIDKKQLAWLIKMLSAYSQHKELRNVLGRLKVVENLNAKFLQGKAPLRLHTLTFAQPCPLSSRWSLNEQ